MLPASAQLRTRGPELGSPFTTVGPGRPSPSPLRADPVNQVNASSAIPLATPARNSRKGRSSMRSHPPDERHSVGPYQESLFCAENHPKGGQPLSTARGLPCCNVAEAWDATWTA